MRNYQNYNYAKLCPFLFYNLLIYFKNNFRKPETEKQRKKRIQREKEEENQIKIDLDEDSEALCGEHSIDSGLCSQMTTKATNNIECPICGTNWCDFIGNKIAAILPCSHACCIKCLLKHYKLHNDESLNKNNFRCPLCNLSLSKNIFQSVALAFVVSKNLIDSFKLYNEMLEFSQHRFDMLVVDSLLKHDFNLNKVEENLWNMVSLVDHGDFLTGQAKQKMYEEARAPVLSLKAEINEIKNQIKSTKDKNIRQILEQKLSDLKRNAQKAQENASNDLFEQINSKMNKESLFTKNKNGFEMYKVDLHGQHVEEAKKKVEELVLPILVVVRQIEIVCGKGNNSRGRIGVLKVELKKNFEEMDIKCKDLVKNDGAFIIYI